MLILGSAEDFHFLRKYRGAQDAGDQNCVYEGGSSSNPSYRKNKMRMAYEDPHDRLSCVCRYQTCQELQWEVNTELTLRLDERKLRDQLQVDHQLDPPIQLKEQGRIPCRQHLTDAAPDGRHWQFSELT